MTADYYAILGVAPTSEDVVIRAAYVALMRRYHPDANASAAAAERAKAITVAYAVLSDPDRRVDYDRARRNGDPYQVGRDEVSGSGNRIIRAQIERVAILAAVLMLLLLPLYLIRYPLTIAEPPGRVRAEPDRRTMARTLDPEQSCISRAAHELVHQQLLRRASQFRRGDRAAACHADAASAAAGRDRSRAAPGAGSGAAASGKAARASAARHCCSVGPDGPDASDGGGPTGSIAHGCGRSTAAKRRVETGRAVDQRQFQLQIRQGAR